ncbi:hypothetical protein FACS1894194_0460 [Bacilli bacterium]|nr:hypothetical protein FACS1894194_0460 [Bacilli bacterium]
MAEQLIILGNGFDLRCGLKSSYKDFYVSRYDSQEYNDKIKYLKDNDVEKFNEIDFVLTIWDIILCEIEDVKEAYWKDIEQVIKEYVLNEEIRSEVPNFYASLDVDSQKQIKNKHDNINDFITKYGHKLSMEEVKLMGNEKAHYNTRAGAVVLDSNARGGDEESQTRLSNLMFGEEFNSKNFYDFLMLELKVFENEFKNYLLKEFKNNKKYNKQSTNILKEIIAYDIAVEPFELKIISFNYTEPFIDLPDKKYYFYEEDLEIEISKIQNVHGSLEHEVVFGIDRNIENETLPDNAIPFTKTYRSLSIRQPDFRIPLFGINTKIIKFYGHSLGGMDYTYFKIIFDSVNLVKGDVQLIFFFSIYDKDKISEIREENYKRIDNLIRRYEDETMGKESDVLLYKLRLEGRLLLLEEGLYWNTKEEK